MPTPVKVEQSRPKPNSPDVGEILYGHFSDEITWDSEQKTAISVRDGVLEYLGIELGLEPHDKIFRVYRSPATIANVAPMMIGIPLTDEHVELDIDVTNPCGGVLTSEMIDLMDDASGSKLGIRNTIDIKDNIRGALATGKRELSLGYKAQLIPHDEYDFEQRKILPHHLAVVQDGRCGSSCSFIDRKPNHEVAEMKNGKNTAAKTAIAKLFTDADGQPNLEQIIEIAQQLPEALRKLPMDELQKVTPALQEIVSMASGASAPAGEEPAVEDEEPELEDQEPEEDYSDEEEDKPMKDAAVKLKIAQAAKDAAAKSVLAHGQVIDKARQFLPDNYSFADKSTIQVMRDTLATEVDEKFEDTAELRMAFKLLRKTESTTKNFGDASANHDKYADLADKEI